MDRETAMSELADALRPIFRDRIVVADFASAPSLTVEMGHGSPPICVVFSHTSLHAYTAANTEARKNAQRKVIAACQKRMLYYRHSNDADEKFMVYVSIARQAPT